MRIEYTFYSRVLERPAHVTVVTHDAMGEQSEQAPVLWLLHGKGADRHAFLDNTQVAHYARTPRITLIMPEVDNSFYADMVHGEAFFAHVAEEVPAMLRNVLAIDWTHARQYVLGASMGGYGALKLALTYPERYSGIATLSGSLRSMEETLALNVDGARPDIANIFGDGTGKVAEKNCPYRLTDALLASGRTPPKIYQYCGEKDYLLGPNLRYRDYALAHGLPLTWATDGGKHDYDAWDKHIKQFIKQVIVADTMAAAGN